MWPGTKLVISGESAVRLKDEVAGIVLGAWEIDSGAADVVDEKACVIDGADEKAHGTESSVTITWSVAEVVKINESALEKTAESLLDETAELTEVATVPAIALTIVGETTGALKTVLGDNTVETAEIGAQVEADRSRAEALDAELLDVLDTEAVAEVVAISWKECSRLLFFDWHFFSSAKYTLQTYSLTKHIHVWN